MSSKCGERRHVDKKAVVLEVLGGRGYGLKISGKDGLWGTQPGHRLQQPVWAWGMCKMIGDASCSFVFLDFHRDLQGPAPLPNPRFPRNWLSVCFHTSRCVCILSILRRNFRAIHGIIQERIASCLQAAARGGLPDTKTNGQNRKKPDDRGSPGPRKEAGGMRI